MTFHAPIIGAQRLYRQTRSKNATTRLLWQKREMRRRIRREFLWQPGAWRLPSSHASFARLLLHNAGPALGGANTPWPLAWLWSHTDLVEDETVRGAIPAQSCA